MGGACPCQETPADPICQLPLLCPLHSGLVLWGPPSINARGVTLHLQWRLAKVFFFLSSFKHGLAQATEDSHLHTTLVSHLGHPLAHHSGFTTLSSFGFSQGTQVSFSVVRHSLGMGISLLLWKATSLAVPEGWRTSAGHWDDSDKEPWKFQVLEEALPRTSEHEFMCGREKHKGAWA